MSGRFGKNLFFRLAALGVFSVLLAVGMNQVLPGGIHGAFLIHSAGILLGTGDVAEVTADSAFSLFLQDSVRFVDLRSTDAFWKDHLPQAVSLPWDSIRTGRARLPRDTRNRLWVFYGENDRFFGLRLGTRTAGEGRRSAVLKGGFEIWLNRSYPLETGGRR